jgi:hypothetical protein
MKKSIEKSVEKNVEKSVDKSGDDCYFYYYSTCTKVSIY